MSDAICASSGGVSPASSHRSHLTRFKEGHKPLPLQTRGLWDLRCMGQAPSRAVSLPPHCTGRLSSFHEGNWGQAWMKGAVTRGLERAGAA